MSETKKAEEPLKVAFLHPDLGLGGAEQLVINLALTCKKLNWKVKLFTPAYDPKRAFVQTKDGTLDVEVHGNYFPRLIFGKCHALCEYIRLLLCALYLLIFGGHYDLVILDQIPFPIPLLNLKFKTFFYCHHPDKLLCTERSGKLKQLYRKFIDYIEELTMKRAHCIVVNSLYTQKVFMESFKSMKERKPNVIYPCIDLDTYFNKDKENKVTKESLTSVRGLEKLKDVDLNNLKVVLSLNRYERKKNLDLAILSYLDYIETNIKNEKDINKSCLIIAGGYDEFLTENKEVYDKLNSYLDTDKKKKLNIFFLKNVDNNERSILLKLANIVLYTPKNEHFGIVPVESMYCGAWVIAHKSGGPMESVVDGKTGYLIDSEDPKEWSKKINSLFEMKNFFGKDGVNSTETKEKLIKHVQDNFSLERMKTDLFYEVSKIFPEKKLKME